MKFEIKDEEKIQLIKDQCKYYDSCLMQGLMTEEQYKEVMNGFMKDLDEIEEKYHLTEFDIMMGKPLEYLDRMDELIQERQKRWRLVGKL